MSARVECFWCGFEVWSEECQYFNHGDGVEGWVCEPCQQHQKERVRDMYELFKQRCEQYRLNPPAPEKPFMIPE